MVNDKILTDIHHTIITEIEIDRQKYEYECGQYLVMCLYAFFRVLLKVNQQQQKTPHHVNLLNINGIYDISIKNKTKTTTISSPYINIKNIVYFNDTLETYIKDHCCEKNRRDFLRLLIEWIHEKRGY